MPLFSLAPPPFLFRGHFVPQRAGDILRPNFGRTCVGDPGSFVYATQHYLYAAAYGWKARLTHIGFYMPKTTAIPIVLMLATQSAFEEERQNRVYLQTLPAQTFRAVFWNSSGQGGGPAEWVSAHPVRISTVHVYTNDALLRAGVQVFRTAREDVFADTGNHLDVLRRHLATGAMTWENRNPRYDKEPRARSADLIKRLTPDPS